MALQPYETPVSTPFRKCWRTEEAKYIFSVYSVGQPLLLTALVMLMGQQLHTALWGWIWPQRASSSLPSPPWGGESQGLGVNAVKHDAHFRDNNTAHKAPSLLQPWGHTRVCSAADSLQTDDSVHERNFPIPLVAVLMLQLPPLQKKYRFLKSHWVLQYTDTGSEEGVRRGSHSSHPGSSSPAFYCTDLRFIAHEKPQMAVVLFPKSLPLEWASLPFGCVSYRCARRELLLLHNTWWGGVGITL